MNLSAIKANIVDYVWSYNPFESGSRHSYWRHFLQIMALVGRDLIGGMLNLRSMGLVYTSLLAFVPLLAVSLSVLKEFGVHDQLEPALTNLLAPLGERNVELSGGIIQFVENMNIGLLGLLGLSMLIYTVISLIHKIESAFNHTWRIENDRNLRRRFNNYLSIVLVGFLLLLSAIGITASLGSNKIHGLINAYSYFGGSIRILGVILPYLLVIGAFTFIYMLVPNTRVKLGSAFYGALMAGVLWESTSLVFTSFVVGSTNFTVIYSGFAIVLLFMIWIYLSWLILLIGASIAYYHQHSERLRWHDVNSNLNVRMREQLALQLMLDISCSCFQLSKINSSIGKLARYQLVPRKMLRRMLDTLVADDLVRRSSEDSSLYQPARPVHSIRLIDILRSSHGATGQDHDVKFGVDKPIAKLLNDIEASYESVMVERTLAELVKRNVGDNSDENSLV